jgi:hypothetical protein
VGKIVFNHCNAMSARLCSAVSQKKISAVLNFPSVSILVITLLHALLLLLKLHGAISR